MTDFFRCPTCACVSPVQPIRIPRCEWHSESEIPGHCRTTQYPSVDNCRPMTPIENASEAVEKTLLIRQIRGKRKRESTALKNYDAHCPSFNLINVSDVAHNATKWCTLFFSSRRKMLRSNDFFLFFLFSRGRFRE